jgi:nucleoside 2-deoxyribosyltransferase
MTPEERRHATFQLDKTRILEADVSLFVLDGRVPDEGACVELGIAYCQKELQGKDKLLVGLQTDARVAFLGSKLNPMVRVPLQYVAEDEEALLRVISDYRARAERGVENER